MNQIHKKNFDIIIIGAGIVGLTLAYEILKKNPNTDIAIIEKEATLGKHASGRNSGVLHCGIFYGSGTQKAQFCNTGAKEMMDFASENAIPVAQNGKLIIATKTNEFETIDQLLKNASDSGIKAYRLNTETLLKMEPHATKALAAIHCPETAVIDSKLVIAKLFSLLTEKGVQFLFNCGFISSGKNRSIRTTQGVLYYNMLYNCAGAYASEIGSIFGVGEEYRLIPFKGIYWKLRPEAAYLVQSSIYPVPDITMPFLGIHLTRSIDNQIYVGPTAIPAFGRENYGLIKGIDAKESIQILRELCGLYWKNANNFRKLAHMEFSKYRKTVFVKAAQNLIPSLQETDLISCDKVGIRPQLVNIKTKKLEMDFCVLKEDHSIHILNSISPAFTCSFAFSKMLVKYIN